MRTDVKLGVILALVMVLTAGSYFMFRGERQKPISLADTAKDAPSNSTTPASKPGTATKPALTNSPKPAANPPARPAVTPRPQPSAANRPTISNPSPTSTTSAPVSSTRPAIGAPLENKPSTVSTPTPNPTMTLPTPAPATAGAPSDASEAKPAIITDAAPLNPTSTTTNPVSASAPAVPTNSPAPTITGSTLGLTGIPSSSSPAVSSSHEPTPNSQPSPNSAANLVANSAASTSSSKPNLPPSVRPNPVQVTPPAPSPVETAEAAVDTHRVQAGDTLTSLSQTYYGDTKFSQFLAESNPKLTDPNRLRIGTVIRIPPLPANRETRTASAPASLPAVTEKSADGKRTYTVKAGDSFYSIAKSQLGNASRWKELLAINNATVNGDPTTLQPGQRLVLPES